MKKIYIYNVVFLIIFFLIFSAGLKVFSGRPYLVPELVLFAVIIFALRRSFTEVLWFSFFAGFLLEIFSGHFFGSRIFATALSGLVIYFITRKLTDREFSMPAMIFLVVIATLLSHSLTYFYHVFFAVFGLTQGIPFSALLNTRIIGTLAMNLAFFYPAFFLHKFLPK